MHLREKARVLRRNMTPPERILWSRVRRRQLLGRKFRSQHVVAGFIADFACLSPKLVIELDGEIHDGRWDLDAERAKLLRGLGFRILRIRNEEVLVDIGAVLARIADALRSA